MTSELIVIDGIDGSGKTRLARRIFERCARRSIACTLVHLDDFKRAIDWSTIDDEIETYTHDYFDFAGVGRHLGALLSTPRDSLVVFDGIFTRMIPAALAGSLVWLEVDEDEARRRIIARDVGAKGRSPAEIERRISRRYFPAHRRYRAEHRPREHADWVLDNRDFHRPKLTRAGRGRMDPEHRTILQEALDPHGQ